MTSSEDVEKTKPFDDIFTLAIRRFRLEGRRPVAVDDTPYDIAAAHQIGVHAWPCDPEASRFARSARRTGSSRISPCSGRPGADSSDEARADPAFHGIVIRVREPEAVARTIRELLGWRTLSRGAHDIVLGEGPELFLAIRKTGRGETEGVESLHLAVERLRRSRRRSAPDALGGDSWTRPLIGDLALTVREFRRAPGSRWRAKRKKPER